ncbi:MAG: c-type cytochrome [Acidobacteriota bacterium]
MNAKVYKLVFILGTLISLLLFMILTFDSHGKIKALTNSQNLSTEVIAGKKVWEKYNCNDCHTILGFGGYYAPDMTKVYARLGYDGIKKEWKIQENILPLPIVKCPINI